MVIDTSAIMAILKSEIDEQVFITAMERAELRLISTASVVEAGVVALSNRGEAGNDDLDGLLERLQVTVVPVSEDHAKLARRAFARFGKGRHPARLNFGDCFSYALAIASGHALLFKGDDFSKTDVKVVPLGPLQQ